MQQGLPDDGRGRDDERPTADTGNAESVGKGKTEQESASLCAARGVVCTDFETAAAWFGGDGLTYRQPATPSSVVETMVVMTTGSGLEADPRAESSVLVGVYSSPDARPAVVEDTDESLRRGAIAVQMKWTTATASSAPSEHGGDLEHDGYTSESVVVRGREATFVETRSPPLSTSTLLIEWSVPVSEDQKILVNIIADPRVVTRAQILDFAERLVGP